MKTVQLSFVPDNDVEYVKVKKPSVPVARLIDNRWCWLKFGSDTYQHEPALEAVLLSALATREQRKAA